MRSKGVKVRLSISQDRDDVLPGIPVWGASNGHKLGVSPVEVALLLELPQHRLLRILVVVDEPARKGVAALIAIPLVFLFLNGVCGAGVETDKGGA